VYPRHIQDMFVRIHHKYIAPLFHEKCKVMYIDMDSLIYYIECDNVYEIMKRNINNIWAITRLIMRTVSCLQIKK